MNIKAETNVNDSQYTKLIKNLEKIGIKITEAQDQRSRTNALFIKI